MPISKHVIFKLGDQNFSLDINDVIMIEDTRELKRVSIFPHNLKGIITLRGEIISVYSLRRKIGLEDISSNSENMLVITALNDNMQIAFEVDEVLGIVDVTKQQFMDVPYIGQTINNTFIKSVIKVNDKLLLYLDKNKLVSEQEKKIINTVMVNKLYEKN